MEQTDPETGLTLGLLTRQREAFYPRVFYTNSSYEYWGRAASLIHTTIDASEDARIPDHVRVYMYAGTQHGPAGFPPGVTIGQQRANPNNFRWGQRALLLAMDRWTRDGGTPPASQYPSIEDGTAVAAENLGFPDIPGVEFSDRVHYAYRADYGPDFLSKGMVTQEPPAIGNRFPIRVSSVDADGNEVAGIRMPEVSGSPRYLYGLEPVQRGVRTAGRDLQHGRFLPAVPEGRRRGAGRRRPAEIRHGPLFEPGGLPRAVHRSRAGADRGRIPARRGPAGAHPPRPGVVGPRHRRLGNSGFTAVEEAREAVAMHRPTVRVATP